MQSLDEHQHRERGLRDMLAILERCDALVLAGGRVSSGMAIERAHAQALHMPIANLTALGRSAPEPTGLIARQALRTIEDAIGRLTERRTVNE